MNKKRNRIFKQQFEVYKLIKEQNLAREEELKEASSDE